MSSNPFSSSSSCDCNAKNCRKKSNFRCPDCQKLGIVKESFFCSKECFKVSWKDHKRIHLLHPLNTNNNDNKLLSRLKELNIDVQGLQQIMILQASKAVARMKGFGGVGKMNGPDAQLFMIAVSSLLDGMNDDVGNETPDEYPLFSSLSPHHRLCLLSEVIIGLLDETAPLPPDTLEHFSTFHAIYWYVFTQIEIEIDNAYQNREWRREERGDTTITRHKKSMMTPEDIKSSMFDDTIMEAGRQFDARERKQIKRVEKAIKALPVDQIDLRDTIDATLDSPVNARKWIDEIYKTFLPGESDDDNDEDFEEDDFVWRKLLHDCLFKYMPTAPFTYRCRSIKKWSVWYRFQLFVNGVVPHKDGEKDLMAGAIDLDLVVSSKTELVRYALLKHRVKDSLLSFESTWTPLQTIQARRSLYLINPNDRKYIFSTDAQSRTEMDNINKDLYAHINAHPEEPSDYGLKMKLRRIAQMAWVGDWHAVMMDQSLSYDSLSDRLKALRQLQLHPPGVIDCFPDWIQISGYDCTPSEWREAEGKGKKGISCCNMNCSVVLEKGMKFCSSCSSVAYCSAECQTEHWPRHKLKCREISATESLK